MDHRLSGQHITASKPFIYFFLRESILFVLSVSHVVAVQVNIETMWSLLSCRSGKKKGFDCGIQQELNM